MTQEAARFLEKAWLLLSHADTMLSVGLNDDAGRTAYVKFMRLTKDEPRVPANLRVFLYQAYNLKSIADYETGPGSEISLERAIDAVKTANYFVEYITSLI
ncbi:MAG: HEPN domain-containing protein [Nitrospirota bacterium]